MFKPELLSPAGTLEEYALRFRLWRRCRLCRPAARTLLRVRNNEFNHENLQLGINEAHALGKNSMWWSTSPRITPS
ncbi:hypothetical protein LNP24_06430 [Klebsiella pneumoniae subsp. pneumoniae]|nr:hypothetical protein [Klebsiella pneumoniae subsp. pneumoniae]